VGVASFVAVLLFIVAVFFVPPYAACCAAKRAAADARAGSVLADAERHFVWGVGLLVFDSPLIVAATIQFYFFERAGAAVTVAVLLTEKTLFLATQLLALARLRRLARESKQLEAVPSGIAIGAPRTTDVGVGERRLGRWDGPATYRVVPVLARLIIGDPDTASAILRRRLREYALLHLSSTLALLPCIIAAKDGY
jgi:hypothetical protein